MKLKIISFSIWNIPFLKTLKLNSKVTQGPKNIIFIFLKVQFTKLKMDQLGLLFGIQTNISYINQQLLRSVLSFNSHSFLLWFEYNLIQVHLKKISCKSCTFQKWVQWGSDQAYQQKSMSQLGPHRSIAHVWSHLCALYNLAHRP